MKCNSCWVEFLTGWFYHVNSSIGCVIAPRGLATTKTTPKRSTYENKNHQCLHLKWSECFQQNWCLCSRLVSCISQIKLPQLVALTEVKGQVNAPVRVIMMTLQVLTKCALIPKRDTYFNGLLTTKTTPKRSTYEHKNHWCLDLKWSECGSNKTDLCVAGW